VDWFSSASRRTGEKIGRLPICWLAYVRRLAHTSSARLATTISVRLTTTMRYQDQSYSRMSAAQFAELEADIHDAEYASNTVRPLDIVQWWAVNDHCYKPGTYYRGFRKRRLMELIDLSSLAGKSVLEVGCGTGELSVFMALHGARVSGFDLSSVGIKMAWRLAAANGVQDLCDFSVQNASCMSYADESFDLVVYNAVLHHALKYPNVREETWRVLKAGGVCAFAEGIRGNPIYRAARRVKRAITRVRVKGDVDIDAQDLENFLSGFVDQKIEFFCLTLGVKQLIGRPYGNDVGRRVIFFLLSHLDTVLLTTMLPLKKYCSEVVGVARKPAGPTRPMSGSRPRAPGSSDAGSSAHPTA
jgi:2-polyprenyl-3-methyl-5-hydroxy-6-metoxy-1,4-benzoquinol methylase